jgi:hypothetical protein
MLVLRLQQQAAAAALHPFQVSLPVEMAVLVVVGRHISQQVAAELAYLARFDKGMMVVAPPPAHPITAAAAAAVLGRALLAVLEREQMVEMAALEQRIVETLMQVGAAAAHITEALAALAGLALVVQGHLTPRETQVPLILAEVEVRPAALQARQGIQKMVVMAALVL